MPDKGAHERIRQQLKEELEMAHQSVKEKHPELSGNHAELKALEIFRKSVFAKNGPGSRKRTIFMEEFW